MCCVPPALGPRDTERKKDTVSGNRHSGTQVRAEYYSLLSHAPALYELQSGWCEPVEERLAFELGTKNKLGKWNHPSFFL